MSDIEKMQKRAVAVRNEYAKTDPKKWKVEQVFMGLVKDVGDLSKILMQHEGYRKADEDTKKLLQHELADVLYSVLVIAEQNDIDLEKSFFQIMDEIEQRFNKK